MNIKRKIIALCEEMIGFWSELQKEVECISSHKQDDIILRWKDYFHEHHDIVSKFAITKMYADNLERKLIEQGVLRLEK